jgi:hypothetical protein
LPAPREGLACCHNDVAHFLTIVGAGPAGYPAAFLAADLGRTVTLIDSAPALGGTCLHRGCIPSKSLLHAARLLSDAREAAAIGLDFAPPAIQLEKLRAWKESSPTPRPRLGPARHGARRPRRSGPRRMRVAEALRQTEPDGSAAAHDFDTLRWPPGPFQPPPALPRTSAHVGVPPSARHAEIPKRSSSWAAAYRLNRRSTRARCPRHRRRMTGGLLPGATATGSCPSPSAWRNFQDII